MEIIDESQKLLQIIEKIKETIEKKKDTSLDDSNLFKGIEVRKVSHDGIKTEDQKEQLLNKAIKQKRVAFKVSYLTTVIQFLDLKTILNISQVNRQFYHFIKSIYFFKIMNNVKDSAERIKKIKKGTKSDRSASTDSGLFEKLTGFLSIFIII
jgi:hypothetical protein